MYLIGIREFLNQVGLTRVRGYFQKKMNWYHIGIIAIQVEYNAQSNR